MGTFFTPKNAVYACKLCDFKCCKNSDWNRHINTIKHTHRVKGNKMETLETNNTQTFVCNCGKEYSCKQSLSIHKKKCSTEKINVNDKNIIIENDINLKELFKLQLNENKELKELFKLQLNENKELKNMILEQSKLMMEICKEKLYSNTIQ